MNAKSEMPAPSGEKKQLLAGRKPSDLLPQPTQQELEFLDVVYEGSVDKLVAWLQLHQVNVYCAFQVCLFICFISLFLPTCNSPSMPVVKSIT